MARGTHRPTNARADDQRGSALTLVLVLVVIVSVSGSMVLARQHQGYKTQSIYTERGVEAAGGDSAINSALAALRYNPERGSVTYNNEDACGTSPDGDAITEENPPDDAQWEDEDIKVFTTFTDENASPPKTYTVKCIPTQDSGATLNSMPGALPYTILALGGYRHAEPVENLKGNTHSSPADDDVLACYDQGENGTPGCEAAIYVGPGAATDANGSGLIVSSSGSLNRNVILANSAIAVRGGRQLTVTSPGRVVVRGKCGGWTNGSVSAGTVSGANVPAGCEQFARDLHADPMLGHRRTDDLVNRDADVVTMLANVIAHGCSYYSNMYIFRPGTYTLTDPLNDLTEHCSGLWWFEPGTYYFDLNYDTDHKGAWNQPPRATSQVVGGAPSGWTPPCRAWGSDIVENFGCNTNPAKRWSLSTGWTGSIAETGKTLVPTAITSKVNWNDPTNTGQALTIDGLTSEVTNTGNTGELTLNTLSTPLPSDATLVQNVKLDLSYAIQNANFQADYPRVRLNMDGGWGSCDLVLPARGTVQNPVVPITVSDLAAACTATSAHAVYGSAGTNKTNNSGVWVPAGTNAAQWRASGNNFTNANWTAALVNNLRAIFLTRSNGSPAKFALDGVKVTVDYTGRPVPAYPGGCGSAQNEGIQWILGGHSRIQWLGQTNYTELCGSKYNDNDDGVEEDPWGLAIYGVGQWIDVDDGQLGATDVETKLPTSYTTGSIATAGVEARFFSGTNANGTPKEVGSAFNGASSGTKPADLYDEVGDGKYTRLKWATNGTAWLEANLPTDLVPAGAYVDEFTLSVWHAEQGNFTAPVRISVSGPGGTPTWNSDDAPMQSGVGPQNTQDMTAATEYSLGQYYLNDDPSQGPDTANWKYGSSLMRKLRSEDGTMTTTTASRINGGTIQLTWNGAGGGADNVAMLDKVSVRVKFRRGSPDSGTCKALPLVNDCASTTVVRPLRGCITTRPVGNPAYYSTGDPRMVGGGIDWDFDPRWVNSAPKADVPFEGPDASGSGGTTDQEACAFIFFDKSEKFHVQGSLYAPTAVADMRGENNQTSFVTGSTIVRSLNTYRWKTTYGLSMSAYGDNGSIKYSDRMVYLRVEDPEGKLIADQRVSITDHDELNTGLQTGRLTETQWYRRRGDD